MDELWIATFPGDVEVRVDAESWTVVGPPEAAEEVGRALEGYARDGWPGVPGDSLDRSPGFDSAWMYARLVAAGAIEVIGPMGAWAEDDVDEGDPELIVG